jgi:ech hydrogenase subunit D
MKGSQTIQNTFGYELMDQIRELHDKGWRMVQLNCVKSAEGLTMNYSFDKDYDMLTLRIPVKPEEGLPSISPVYPASYLYENEISEQYGFAITGKTLDFNGGLYKTAVKHAFRLDDPKAEALRLQNAAKTEA